MTGVRWYAGLFYRSHTPPSVQRRQELIQKFREKIASPYTVPAHGRFDRIIDPKVTRKELVQMVLRNLEKKDHFPGKKHGIIPVQEQFS